MSSAPRRRVTPRTRALAALAGVLAAVGVLLALNWTSLTTTPATIVSAQGVPESRELTLSFGSCLLDYIVTVDETAEEVRALILLAAPRIEECPAILASTTVILAEPLGDRALIDSSTDAVVDVEPRDER